jgi:hypothetical protein
MAVGWSAAAANAVLDAMCRSVAWTEPTNIYVKLHVGDPGAAATSNAATNTTRQQAIFASGASGGAISNTTALVWTSVAGSEDYTHFSVWDSATVGAFQFSGTITANAVTSGDTFTIPIGDLDVSLAIAS